MKYVLAVFLIWVVAIAIYLAATAKAYANRCDDFCSVSPVLISPKGAYSKTLENWQTTLEKYHLQGTSWLGVVEGNGAHDPRHRNKKRDTLIWIPHALQRTEEVTLVLWFHGLGGFRLDSHRVGTSIVGLDKLGKNYVLVIPEMPWSINTSTRRKRQTRAWNTRRFPQENLEIFYDNVLKILFEEFEVSPDRTFIIGHSAGGSAVRNAAKNGHLDVLKPEKIVFSDAGYGTWTDQAWKWHVRKHPNCKFILLVRKWDKPYHNTMRFLKRFAKREIPANIILRVFPRKKYRHSDIGDLSMYMDVVWE